MLRPLAHASLNTGEWYASKGHLLAACQHRVLHDPHIIVGGEREPSVRVVDCTPAGSSDKASWHAQSWCPIQRQEDLNDLRSITAGGEGEDLLVLYQTCSGAEGVLVVALVFPKLFGDPSTQKSLREQCKGALNHPEAKRRLRTVRHCSKCKACISALQTHADRSPGLCHASITLGHKQNPNAGVVSGKDLRYHGGCVWANTAKTTETLPDTHPSGPLCQGIKAPGSDLSAAATKCEDMLRLYCPRAYERMRFPFGRDHDGGTHVHRCAMFEGEGNSVWGALAINSVVPSHSHTDSYNIKKSVSCVVCTGDDLKAKSKHILPDHNIIIVHTPGTCFIYDAMSVRHCNDLRESGGSIVFFRHDKLDPGAHLESNRGLTRLSSHVWTECGQPASGVGLFCVRSGSAPLASVPLAKFFKRIDDAHNESGVGLPLVRPGVPLEFEASGGPKVLGRVIAPCVSGEFGDLVHLPCVQFADDIPAPPVMVHHDNGGGGCDGGGGDDISDDVNGEELPDELGNTSSDNS